MKLEEHILTQRLPLVGSDVQVYPNLKTGRPGPVLPPVSGMVGWWDVSDVSSLTFSGGLLTSLADKSGSGFTATKGAVSDSLTGMVVGGGSVLAHRPCVVVAPGGYYSTSLPANDRTQTCFYVGMVPTLAANRVLIGCNIAGGRLFRIDATTGKLFVVKSNVVGLFQSTTLAVTAGVPFVACCVIDTSTIELRLNNGTPETKSESTTFDASAVTRLSLEAASLDFGSGLMSEVLVYGTALSSGDVDATMKYLMAKWNIT